VDGWYYCPHHPRGEVAALRVECECRKPRPGMIRQAQQAFEIDLGRSAVVGDKTTDVALASGVGARGVLVLTGHGEAERARAGGTVTGASHVAANLMDATSWILTERGQGRRRGERRKEEA
jgi:histidinol phosphatase-like enzyme